MYISACEIEGKYMGDVPIQQINKTLLSFPILNTIPSANFSHHFTATTVYISACEIERKYMGDIPIQQIHKTLLGLTNLIASTSITPHPPHFFNHQQAPPHIHAHLDKHKEARFDQGYCIGILGANANLPSDTFMHT